VAYHLEIGPTLWKSDLSDSLQHSWISWCPGALGFWEVL